jgi:hypothetical protein
MFFTLTLATSSAAGAGSMQGSATDFCAGAQQQIARTELIAEVVNHTDYESFVQSKATASPLVVQQYFSNPAPGPDAIARVVSCKMKTAERINNDNMSADDPTPVAAGDRNCHALHEGMLADIVARIPAQELSVSPEQLIVDEEQLAYMGPMWLKPWPFEPLARDESGQLHLQSKALYVPFAWWIPMPDRFKGTYYCHLIAPQFLEALLRGETAPGV